MGGTEREIGRDRHRLGGRLTTKRVTGREGGGGQRQKNKDRTTENERESDRKRQTDLKDRDRRRNAREREWGDDKPTKRSEDKNNREGKRTRLNNNKLI